MKKHKLLAVLLALVMTLSLLPTAALAADLKGAVEGITPGATINDGAEEGGVPVKQVLYSAPTTLEWVEKDASAGRNDDGWWVGIKVTAPTGYSPENAKYDNGSGYQNFTANADGDKSYITLWGYVTPELLQTCANAGYNWMSYTWKFDWDGIDGNEQIVRLFLKVNQLTLTKDSDVLYPCAKIGEVGYQSLDAAIAAVPSVDGTTTALPEATTITLLAGTNAGVDIGNSSGTAAKNVILDLNGNTLTLGPAIGSTGTETNGLRVLAYSKLQIQNGTVTNSDIVNSKGKRVAFLLVNYSEMTLTDVTVTPYAQASLAINNRGNLTLAGTTDIQNPTSYNNYGGWPASTPIAITNDPYNYFYATKNATINVADANVSVGNVMAELYGNSTNSGTVEFNISAGDFGTIYNDGSTARTVVGNITGGTFSTDPRAYVATGFDVTSADGKFTVAAHHDHTYATEWSKDSSGHWHAATCEHTTEKADFEAHTSGGPATENTPETCTKCGYEIAPATGPVVVPVESVTLNTTNMTLTSIGASNNTMPLTATITPENATDKTVTFSSSDEAVATVDQSGYVTAVGAGTATITATVGGKTATCAVTVSIAPEPQTMQVDFRVTPTNATIEVKDAQGNAIAANQYGGYDLLPGETYTYTVSASGYVTKTGSFVPSLTAAGGNLVTVDLVRETTGGGGGGSSSSNTTTTTEKNADGSTTTTTTDKTTGTVTETTKNTDGSTTTVETKKDGTVTETNKTADGTTGTVVTDKDGEVTSAKASVSTTAAKEAVATGEAVTLPVEVPAASSTGDAPTVQVSVPKSAGSVKVEIPVEKVTPGTVAVIVNADGTEKIVSTSVVTENGVALTLDGSATVKVIDNSKDFADVPASNVFYNEISSLSAREIMIGKTEDTFDLYNSVTLNQIANVAGRITGEVDVKDYNAGIAWGNEKGLKTGDEPATRGEVLKALYVAAGSPAVEDTSILSIFNDSTSIPADMAAIAAWAAQNGILKGTVDGKADLGVNVTRGQACALAGRAMSTLA